MKFQPIGEPSHHYLAGKTTHLTEDSQVLIVTRCIFGIKINIPSSC